MPTFEIEQYELHTMKYRVRANSQAEAIAKLLNGELEPVEGSLEFIEVAENLGLPANHYSNLAVTLKKLGVAVKHVIPSIRGIERVEG